MQLTDFTYELPESRIADRPPEVRGSSKLLVIKRSQGVVADSLYRSVADFLEAGDVVILNDTKVIPARLRAMTDDGRERELLLLERHGQTAYGHSARVMYRRKLHPGQTLRVGTAQVTIDELYGDGTARITANTEILGLAEEYGAVPLPPYMRREADATDRERYQTVFAKHDGSVAAPTASLNMTDDVLASIREKGVNIGYLTLHVGLGTFMPIREDDITKHHMHQEYFEIPRATADLIRQAKQDGRRVIAVGTTVTRTLEYAAKEILTSNTDTIQGEADIYIYPGYTFKMVDAMLTNFHAPHSTVLMMAAAFTGWDTLKSAYEYAVDHEYKFLSYGDSTFLI